MSATDCRELFLRRRFSNPVTAVELCYRGRTLLPRLGDVAEAIRLNILSPAIASDFRLVEARLEDSNVRRRLPSALKLADAQVQNQRREGFLTGKKVIECEWSPSEVEVRSVTNWRWVTATGASSWAAFDRRRPDFPSDLLQTTGLCSWLLFIVTS